MLDPHMEDKLGQWIEEQENVIGHALTRTQIKRKARELCTIPGFKASKGWLDKFKRRRNINFLPMFVESASKLIEPMEIQSSISQQNSYNDQMKSSDNSFSLINETYNTNNKFQYHNTAESNIKKDEVYSQFRTNLDFNNDNHQNGHLSLHMDVINQKFSGIGRMSNIMAIENYSSSKLSKIQAIDNFMRVDEFLDLNRTTPLKYESDI